LGDSSEPQRYPQFPATDFDPMGTYEPPVRLISSGYRKFDGSGDGTGIQKFDGSGRQRRFYGYGADGSPIYVENVSAKATKFLGYQKDGSPIFVENLSAKAYLGNMKDGTPIFVNAAEMEVNPINVAGTVAIIGAGLAFGWLLARASAGYLK